MYKKEININEKFGNWTVINLEKERKNGYLIYLVKCSCGTHAKHNGNYLRSLKSKYCRSCSAKKRFGKAEESSKYKHGATLIGSPLRPTYKIWVSMKQRCYDESCKSYKNYGLRGIKICDNWLKSFENFLNDMGVCPENLSLDRTNNDGNYEKLNCTWVTRKQQNNNRRNNTFFIIDGIRITRSLIQEKLNLTRDMYRRRLEKHGVEWLINQFKETI